METVTLALTILGALGGIARWVYKILKVVETSLAELRNNTAETTKLKARFDVLMRDGSNPMQAMKNDIRFLKEQVGRANVRQENKLDSIEKATTNGGSNDHA